MKSGDKGQNNTYENGDAELSGGLPMRPRKVKARVNPGAIFTLALVIAIAVVAFLIVRSAISNRNREPVFVVTDAGQQGHMSVSVTPTPEPELRPTAAESGYLPVFYRANTDKRQVALTVSGKINESQMTKLLENAAALNARLTFFPTGEALESNPTIWTQANLMGHEIESAGYSGKRYLAMDSAAERAGDIDKAIGALRDYINIDYSLHFLRTSDMYDDEYLELHRILASRGVYGIARQAVQLSSSTRQDEIAPGVIINTEIGSLSVDEINAFMRWLNENGYELVTMNTLFEYDANYLSTAETE